jgi:hypothetical protein
MKVLMCLVLGFGMLFLQGCWFVIIPIGPIVKLIQGPRLCSPMGKAVGDRMRTPGGRWATITEVLGEDQACMNPSHPILVGVKWDEEIKEVANESIKER